MGNSNMIVDGKLPDKEAKIIAEQMVNFASNKPQQVADLADRTRDARSALELAIGTIKESWSQFRPQQKEILEELRTFRMAVTTESATASTAANKLIAITKDESFKAGLSQLREMIALCDRLEELHKSGLLDAFMDMALRLPKKS